MKERLLDAETKKERDLQLDMELEGTFPASDPLKVTRVPIAKHDRIRIRRLETPSAKGMAGRRKTSMSRRIAADRLRLKRAYEPPASDDGTRILVDRLWPRGMKKATAAIDEWMKEIAPSTELRKWFGHAAERWPEFRRRYRSEIQQHPVELGRLRVLARNGPVTLVYSAHNDVHTDAVVLRDFLLNGD